MVDKNHELGTHNCKICAEISTGSTPNTPQVIQPICPNRPIIWEIFEKSPHHMTIVHGSKHQPISLTYRRQKKHKVNLFDRGYESFLRKMLHGIPIRIWIEKPVDFTTIKSVKYVPGTGGG